jgi:hypothetical protein
VPSIVEAVREQKADVPAMSAAITTQSKPVEELIEQVRADASTRTVQDSVGDYPFQVVPAPLRALLNWRIVPLVLQDKTS